MFLPEGLLPRALSVLAAAVITPVAAGPEQRSSFPGRRVGGGTRGECTARLLVHLVPESSVFSPDSGRLLGVLLGPTQAPKPLLVDLRRLAAAGTVDTANSQVRRLRFAPSAAGVTLFRATIVDGVVWESSYQCNVQKSAEDAEGNGTGFDAPPGLTLLLVNSTADDRQFQDRLRALSVHCDSTVTKRQLTADFRLSNLDLSTWPDRLQVRCAL